MATSVPPIETLPPASGLSEVERVVDTFVAPSKTFTDIRRSSAWWMPFLIVVIISYGFGYAVQSRVGWSQVVENTLRAQPKQMDKLEQSPPEQQQRVRNFMAGSMKWGFILTPALILLFAAIIAGIFMLTCNFGVGGTGKYSQYFAVWIYAGLPLAIQSLLTIILLFAGGGGETFRMDNPIGTNLGYYFAPGALSPWLSKLLTSVDIFTLWSLVLMSIGCATVARISRSAGAAVVFGWWFFALVVKVAWAAIQG